MIEITEAEANKLKAIVFNDIHGGTFAVLGHVILNVSPEKPKEAVETTPDPDVPGDNPV